MDHGSGIQLQVGEHFVSNRPTFLGLWNIFPVLSHRQHAFPAHFAQWVAFEGESCGKLYLKLQHRKMRHQCKRGGGYIIIAAIKFEGIGCKTRLNGSLMWSPKAVTVTAFWICIAISINPLTAKLFNWNFQPLEVVDRVMITLSTEPSSLKFRLFLRDEFQDFWR